MNPLYKSTASLKNAEELNETGLNIPLHPSMTMNDVDYVVEKIKGCELLK